MSTQTHLDSIPIISRSQRDDLREVLVYQADLQGAFYSIEDVPGAVQITLGSHRFVVGPDPDMPDIEPGYSWTIYSDGHGTPDYPLGSERTSYPLTTDGGEDLYAVADAVRDFVTDFWA